jgi:hypothetical protein
MSGPKDVVAVFDGPAPQPVGTNEHHEGGEEQPPD